MWSISECNAYCHKVCIAVGSNIYFYIILFYCNLIYKNCFILQVISLMHRIHNGTQTTKWRLDRLLLLSFTGLRLSKADSGMSFSVKTTAAEFEVAFAIL